jgi:hypothetical protein
MQLHTIPVSVLRWPKEVEADKEKAGTPTGSPSGPPPPTSDQTTSAILDAAKGDPTAQTQGGTDGAESGPGPHGEGEKPKSAKESTDNPKPALY